MRAKVARAYVKSSDRSSLKILDRQGRILVSGQDMEIGYFACNLGLGMGNFTGLRLTHLIPKERVGEEYILRMMEGQELAWALLAYKWWGAIPRSPLSLREALSLVKTILLRPKIDRQVQFARLRATVKARRIIFDTRKQRQTAGEPSN